MRPEPSFSMEEVERRLRPALMAFFLRRVSNRAEAEDLTQEVFIRLAGSDGAMRSADAYMFQVAANLLRDRARRHKVRERYRQSVLLEGGSDLVDPLDPFRVMAGRENLNALATAIACLPEKTRRIFTLYRLENMDKQTIAQSFGLSVRAIEQHIQKAMTILFDRLGEAL